MATKNEAWVDEWQSMSFCFCCHHFCSERLTAALLFDDHYASQPAKHREDNGKCLQFLKNYSQLLYSVCYERHFMFLPLISLFLGFYQQANLPLWKCFTAWISQKQPPDAGSCSMQFLFLGHTEIDQQAVSVSLTSVWEMRGLHSIISYKYPGKFSIPQLIEQIFYASALCS